MGYFVNVIKQLGCVAIFIGLSSPVLASAPMVNEKVVPHKMAPHEIFRSLYSDSETTSVQVTALRLHSKLNSTIKRVKRVTNFSLVQGVSFKFAKVASGTLREELTEVAPVVPSIQTHDDRTAQDSQGYGIKFSMNF